MPPETPEPTTAGETPAAGTGAASVTPAATVTAPVEGSAGPAGGKPVPGVTPAEAQPTDDVSGLRAALAAERKERAKFESELKKLQDKDLTETEKLRKQVAEFEQRNVERDRQEQESRVRVAAVSAAARQGFANPDLAVRLLDRAAIEFDPAGQPTNIEKQLAGLLKDNPGLSSSHSRASGSIDIGGSGTPNPYTAEAIKKMTPMQVADHWGDILKANGGKIPTG